MASKCLFLIIATLIFVTNAISRREDDKKKSEYQLDTCRRMLIERPWADPKVWSSTKTCEEYCPTRDDIASVYKRLCKACVQLCHNFKHDQALGRYPLPVSKSVAPIVQIQPASQGQNPSLAVSPVAAVEPSSVESSSVEPSSVEPSSVEPTPVAPTPVSTTTPAVITPITSQSPSTASPAVVVQSPQNAQTTPQAATQVAARVVQAPQIAPQAPPQAQPQAPQALQAPQSTQVPTQDATQEAPQEAT